MLAHPLHHTFSSLLPLNVIVGSLLDALIEEILWHTSAITGHHQVARHIK